ncbi:hypothetical protein LTR37_017650 [Vermiconidia calcicola]|uniref:Uncharacterized protein n=1 Tax=Vermiconidia calcicola TaxID=1690605 RepID=A0ACC3MKN9_9PEZI|nr:hypothetical protein LTR37_017650 [Vermiconidia calcicola]
MAAANADVGAAVAAFVNDTKAEIRNLKQTNVSLAKRVEALEATTTPAQKMIERQDAALTQMHLRSKGHQMRIDNLEAQLAQSRDERSDLKRGLEDLTKQHIDQTKLVNDLEHSQQQRKEQERLLTELGAYLADARNEHKRLRIELDGIKSQHQELVAQNKQIEATQPQSTKPQCADSAASQVLQQPEPVPSRLNKSNVNTDNMPPPKKLSCLTFNTPKLPVGGVNENEDREPEPSGFFTARSSFERETSVASSVTFCNSSQSRQRKPKRLEQLTHSDSDFAGHGFSSTPEEGDFGAGGSQGIVEAESTNRRAHTSLTSDIEPMEVENDDDPDMPTPSNIREWNGPHKRRRINSTESTGASKGDDLHLPNLASLQSQVKNRQQQVAGAEKAVVPSTQERFPALRVSVCHLDVNLPEEEEEDDDDDTIVVRPRKKQALIVSALNSAVSTSTATSSNGRMADQMLSSFEVDTPTVSQENGIHRKGNELQAASATDAKANATSQTASAALSLAKNGTLSSTPSSSSGSDKALTAQTIEKAKGAAKAVTSSDLLK